MPVKLFEPGVRFARELIAQGGVVRDERDAWSDDQPSAADENTFIRAHGYDEYGKWHLGIDDRYGARTKSRYSFPFGDFKNVHRCALLSAESRAGQYGHVDIEQAAHRLHTEIDRKEG